MSKITITQGPTTVRVGEIYYHGNEGFQEGGTWYVDEECIRAGLDRKLTSGEAMIRRDEKSYAVKIEVLEHIKDSKDEDDESVCEVEIKPREDKLAALADALGLLDHYSRKQKTALGL